MCAPLPTEELADISEGLKVDADLPRGAAVEVAEADDSTTVVLGLSDPETVSGTILAADNVARVFFS